MPFLKAKDDPLPDLPSGMLNANENENLPAIKLFPLSVYEDEPHKEALDTDAMLGQEDLEEGSFIYGKSPTLDQLPKWSVPTSHLLDRIKTWFISHWQLLLVLSGTLFFGIMVGSGLRTTNWTARTADSYPWQHSNDSSLPYPKRLSTFNSLSFPQYNGFVKPMAQIPESQVPTCAVTSPQLARYSVLADGADAPILLAMNLYNSQVCTFLCSS